MNRPEEEEEVVGVGSLGKSRCYRQKSMGQLHELRVGTSPLPHKEENSWSKAGGQTSEHGAHGRVPLSSSFQSSQYFMCACVCVCVLQRAVMCTEFAVLLREPHVLIQF